MKRISYNRDALQTPEAVRQYVTDHRFYLLFYRENPTENFSAEHIYASTTDLDVALELFDALVPEEGLAVDAFIATITGDCIADDAIHHWLKADAPLEHLLFGGRAAGLYTSSMLVNDRLLGELHQRGYEKVKGRPSVVATLKKDNRRYEFRETKDLREFLSLLHRAEALLGKDDVEEEEIRALEEAMKAYHEVGERPL